jgi:Ca2+-binding RTX toxin-like protein
MAGGAGDDIYYVDSASDVVSEAADAGIDRINAYINYSLGATVENLYLYGSATTGTGNALDNTIVGNSSDNYLYGQSGNDSLYGQAGNDSLYGDNGSDYLNGGNGNDCLTGGSGTDYLEGGNGTDYLYGNAGNDTLSGDTGNDTLSGGAGNDYIYGGSGNDMFVFSESGSNNCDMIGDFSHVDDMIVLKDILDGVTDSSIMGLSFTDNALNASSYFEGANYTGNGTESSGIYNDTTTGNIWYNPTSNVAGDSMLICAVGVTTASSLDNTDFVYSA